MNKMKQVLTGNNIDDDVDITIQNCIISIPPKSFFMFAGAGSGKTRSLIKVLQFIKEKKELELKVNNRKVAIITYTNAACDEILKRLDYSPLFVVQTIHSFLWELIKPFQKDIKNSLISLLKIRKERLEEENNNSKRSSTKRIAEINYCVERLKNINEVKKFNYSPTQINSSHESLSHDEMLKISIDLLTKNNTIKLILINKFPYLFIDESQDTKKELIDVLIMIYQQYKNQWVIGMFGDTMQRIYADGKENIEAIIPADWEQPNKIMNHRSNKRIVTLANNIRKWGDNKKQQSRNDTEEGIVRLFVVSQQAEETERIAIENTIAEKMETITSDNGWKNDFITLILEHKMAARRLGFLTIFEALAKEFPNEVLKSGAIPEIVLFENIIIPIYEAYKNNNKLNIMTIMRNYSPLLEKNILKITKCPQEQLKKAHDALKSLCNLFEDNTISCLDIIKEISLTKLFYLTDHLKEILSEEELLSEKALVFKEALQCSFTEMQQYLLYIQGKSRFATHQGIKGLEFPRVMVIINDEESKGFLFSYDKLFGIKEKTPTDIKNELENKETSIQRTARLFYVICTRAKNSLAVVIYSNDQEKIKKNVLNNNWFYENEIIYL